MIAEIVKFFKTKTTNLSSVNCIVIVRGTRKINPFSSDDYSVSGGRSADPEDLNTCITHSLEFTFVVKCSSGPFDRGHL